MIRLALILALLCSPALAGERWTAVDGDTVEHRVDTRRTVSTERLRLAGIDAPELHARCLAEMQGAIAARDFVQAALAAATVIEIDRGRREKWGRSMARLYLDGRDLSEMLLQAGLVRPYRGEKRRSWCESP